MGHRKCLHADHGSASWTRGGLLIVADGDHHFNARRDFYSRRKENQKELRYVVIGCLLVIIGGVLLGYMKAHKLIFFEELWIYFEKVIQRESVTNLKKS